MPVILLPEDGSLWLDPAVGSHLNDGPELVVPGPGAPALL